MSTALSCNAWPTHLDAYLPQCQSGVAYAARSLDVRVKKASRDTPSAASSKNFYAPAQKSAKLLTIFDIYARKPS